METYETLDDAVNPDVLKAIREWRYEESRRQQIPPFWILSNRMMASIALHQPKTLDDLLGLPGMGKARVEKYGEAILQAVAAGQPAAVPPPPQQPALPSDTALAHVVYRIASERQAAVLQAAGIYGAQSCGQVELKITL